MSTKKRVLKAMGPQLRDVVHELEQDEIPHFFTGSRCWGVHTPDSDYELCINFDNYESVKKIICDYMKKADRPAPRITFQGNDDTERLLNERLHDAPINLKDSDFEHSSYGAGVKIDIGGDHLNIIRLLEGDFLFWLLSTNSMSNIANINPQKIVNKTLRHSIFENLRSIAKATITYEGWKLDEKVLLEKIKELGG